MITIKQLYKAFGKTEVLTGVSTDFAKPEITAVLGPNGSGKTTLIKCVMGMVIPDNGQITVDGTNIKGSWKYRHLLNYLPQIARFPDNLNVSEIISMVKSMREQEANDGALIEHFELQPYLHKRLGTLSGGTRQKVNLVLALMYDNPVLILDEPTAGLDPVAMLRLKEIIKTQKTQGKIILITTHIMSFVQEMADRIVMLLDGQIRLDAPVGELLATHQSIEHAVADILGGAEILPNPEQQAISRNGNSVRSAFHSLKNV